MFLFHIRESFYSDSAIRLDNLPVIKLGDYNEKFI